VAVVAIGVSLWHREISLFQLSLVFSLLVLVVVLRDVGADYNHLLDLAVLTALVVGELWARPRSAHGRASLVAPLLTAVVVLGALSAYADTARPDVALAARLAVGDGSDAEYSTHPLRGIVGPRDTLLSEDPSLAILSGRVPVTDPLILPRLAESHPEWIAELRRRIERHGFDDVVLIRPLDPNSYHATQSFGREITAAIAANYRFEAVVPTGSLTYFVYVPRRAAND
jgi:hypothetical protein